MEMISDDDRIEPSTLVEVEVEAEMGRDRDASLIADRIDAGVPPFFCFAQAYLLRPLVCAVALNFRRLCLKP
jgi:hypothetical protein